MAGVAWAKCDSIEWPNVYSVSISFRHRIRPSNGSAFAAIEIRVNKLHFAVEQYVRRETKAINVSRTANEEVVSELRKKSLVD